MPTMASITVKKADGTTDVVYTQLTGSAGDKSPAVWANKTVGTTPAEWPTFTLTSSGTTSGSARRLIPTFTWPTATVDAGGNKTITGSAYAGPNGILLPRNMPQSDINEVVHQYTNLCASTLFRDSLKEGYAPR